MSEGTLRIVEEIRAKLRQLSRRITLADLAYGALVSTGAISVMLLLATLAEALLWMPTGLRWFVFTAFALASAVLLVWFVLRPAFVLAGWAKGIEESEVARRVGTRFPVVKDRLVNFLDLASGRSSVSTVALIEGAISQLGLKLREPDYAAVERFARAKEASRVATLPLIGLLAFMLIDPTGFTGAARRLASPGTFFAKPAPFTFIVDPGDAQVVKGDSLEMVVHTEGREEPVAIQLEIRRANETRSRFISLDRSEDGTYVHTERNIRDGFSYRALAGDISTRDFEVGVVSRPFVRSLGVTIQPPAYTRLSSQTLAQNVGDFAAYPGSRVSIGVEASKDVASARVEFDDADSINLSLNQGLASGEFVVTGDDRYRVRLVDDAGLSNDEPILYRIQKLVDEYPGIAVLYPEPDEQLTDELMIPIGGRLSDDFGFSRLTLNFRLSESVFGERQENFSEINLPIENPRALDQGFSHEWDLTAISGLDLVPGDVVEYYLEVRDNDQVGGFKATSSPVYTLRFPSLTEQFDQLDDRQSEVKDDLESLLRDSREVQESFEQLRDELRRDQDGDWDDERQLERLREQQRQLEERADELTDQVDEMVEQMQQNDLLSPETMERFQEMKRVFEEINSPELEEALEKLRQAMEDLDLSEMQKSIGEVEFNEEQFLERLERALELFKRLRAEQKLEEASRRAEDLAERQRQIEEKTKSLSKEETESDQREPTDPETERKPDENPEEKDTSKQGEQDNPNEQGDKKQSGEPQETPESQSEDLAREQERSAEDMKALEELLEKIREQMEEIRQAPTDQMEQLLQQTKQQALPSKMQQNAQQLRQGQMNKAQQGQQQMQQMLQQMSDQLQQMQGSMTGEQIQRNLAALRRALDDVLTLSLEQEELRDEVRQVAQREAGLRRFTQQQAELHEGLETVGDSLVALSREIPQMSRKIQTHAGQASMEMSRAVDEMVERRGAQGVAHQKGAMTNLNELALLLSELMQNMQSQSSGMGGMGMQQMLQQLQQMAGDQAKLNQQIQQMLNDMQGSRLSQEMAKRLQQMAAQQEAMRRQLEQMGQNAPSEAERLLGDLKQIAKQMEESIEEMRQRNVDSRTVRRQQEILTRLLNAQKSIRERGRENRREGRTGEEIRRASPSELPPDQRAEQLRRELLDALETGYSADFEELIRRYFELLQEQEAGQE